MNISKLSEASNNLNYGGKINGLIQLHQNNYLVPEGLILPASLITLLWENIITNILDTSLDKLSISLLQQADFKLIEQKLQNIVFPDELMLQIETFIESGKNFIVRSSALLEDHGDTSFAGQYDSVLNCQSLDDIQAAIIKIIRSFFHPDVLTYWQKNQLPIEQFALAILIQEQIDASISGVAFSMNPVTTNDQEILIEFVAGHNQALVEGKIDPYQLSVKWDKLAIAALDTVPLLSKQQLRKLCDSIQEITLKTGYPVDLEFCFKDDELYFVQVRPITQIKPLAKEGQWTTANFRDGGVAAQPAPNLMWSLYRDSWQKSLSDYLTSNQLLNKDEINDLILLKFARPYWNIGTVKEVMLKIPGFTEREFDDELGVHKNYSDSGRKSQISLKSLFYTLKVAFSIRQTRKIQQANVKTIKNDLIKQYETLQSTIDEMNDNSPTEAIELLWHYIIDTAHMESETNYFKQVFINTVELARNKPYLLKHLTRDQLFKAYANIGNISHLQPLKYMIEIVENIQADEKLLDEWKTIAGHELKASIEGNPHRLDSLLLHNFQKNYGYHSLRELNLLTPNYSEDIQYIIDKIQSYILNNELFYRTKKALQFSNTDLTTDTLSYLSANNHKNKKLQSILKHLRELLWWREEFKDISSRYYHLVRQISLKLGERYSQEGKLKLAEDIFYIKKESVEQFMKDELSKIQLQEEARLNRIYCESYRHFDPPTDLFAEISDTDFPNHYPFSLKGIGANSGIAKGKVRIIQKVSDLRHIKKGDILVTKYTDTGWSDIFSQIDGLITETGGVLCHASIVAREFGIPTIVSAKEATQRLTTGMSITMNGLTGEIIIDNEE